MRNIPPISEYEAKRILEFFRSNPENENKLISIAKTITKNTLTALSSNDAYKIILLHSESINSILSRKIVSKEMLLKYLTEKDVPVTNNFTKNTLVDQVTEFWRKNGPEYHNRQPQCSQHYGNQQNNSTEEHHIMKQNEHFPINLMAKNFCDWFYKNLNESTIQANDFWSDCDIFLQLIDRNRNIREESTVSSHLVLNMLHLIKSEFNIYFNPNLSYEGTRGKINSNGLVLILCCGTIHSNMSVADGTFNSIFGLMRDPFCDNNWKMKNIKIKIQSLSDIQKAPKLENCTSLQHLLALPECEESM